MAAPKGRLVTPVGFDPSGYPLALEVDADGYLKVSIAAPAAGLVGAHGYVGGAWHKNPIQFGYSDVLNISVENTNIPAGNSYLETLAVPDGCIWVVTNISMVYYGTSPPNIVALISGAEGELWLFGQKSPVSGISYDRQGWWVLKAGNSLKIYIKNGTAGDDIHLYVTGFVTQINL